MRILFLLTLLIFAAPSAWAQSPVDSLDKEEMKEFRRIRSHIRKTPAEFENDPDLLADYLGQGMSNRSSEGKERLSLDCF